MALLWRDHQRHSLAQQPACLVNLRNVTYRLGNFAEKLTAPVLVGKLPASKDKGKLNLVPLFDKLTGVFDLNINIVLVGFGTQANLLKSAGVVGFFAGLAGLSLLLIEPFAVVHYPANRRFAGRRHLDKVKSRLASFFEGEISVNNSDLIVRFIDESNLIGSYLSVYPQPLYFN
jgi:hypothetical protein